MDNITLNDRQIRTAQRGLLIGGILVMFTQMGIANNCFSIFIIPICEDLGFARGQFSMCGSFLSLGAAVASYFSGTIYSRQGIVRVMKISAVGLSLVYGMQIIAS